jgi:cytochrome P450
MISIPDLTSPSHKANPFPLYARLRSEAPIVRVIFGDKKPVYLVTRHADVAAALKDPRLTKNPFRTLTPEEQKRVLPWAPRFIRPLMTSMIDQDPPDHTRLRGLVQKAFTPRTVEELRVRVETITAELVARARARGSFDLLEDVAVPLPITVICDLLGVPEAERMRFRSIASRVVSIISPMDAILGLPTLWMLVRYLRSLIAKRRRTGGDDLLAALIRAEEAGDRLSEDELLAMAWLLLLAGHETTVNLIASGTLALLEDAESLQRLRHEPALMKPAVEELLRFTSPVDMASERYTSVEVAFGEHVIPRGQRVFAVLASANYDEQVFERPERLMLDREPNRHLSLGHGAHYCLGAPLARLEAQIAFTAILRDLPGLALAVPRESLRWKPSPILRGLARLPVRCATAPSYSIPRTPRSEASAHP